MYEAMFHGDVLEAKVDRPAKETGLTASGEIVWSLKIALMQISKVHVNQRAFEPTSKHILWNTLLRTYVRMCPA